MVGFDAVDATFVGFVVEGILWGLYIPLFALSFGSLLWKKAGHSINWFTLIATLILFVLCTLHFSLTFSHVYNGLVVHPNPELPISVQTVDTLFDSLIFTVTDFVAQTVLIYRCWRIYEKNYWIVAFPSLISLGSISCGLIGSIWLLMIASTGFVEPPPVLVSLGIASFTLSLSLNVLVTVLILSRIYLVTRNTRNNSQTLTQSGLGTALEAFIESGALFMLAQMIFVVLFAIRNNGQLVAVDIAAQIYGIAPTLLIARVAIGKSLRNASLASGFSRAAPSAMLSHAHTQSQASKISNWEMYKGGSNV